MKIKKSDYWNSVRLNLNLDNFIDQVIDDEIFDAAIDDTLIDLFSSSSASRRPVLRKGDRGSAVIELQQLLSNAGYSLVVDGIFGSNTENAVRSFQRKKVLADDGIVGPNTWSTLMNSEENPTSKLLLKNVTSCSTHIANGLSKQLVLEMNRIAPNSLVDFRDLDVKPSSDAAFLLLQPEAKSALRKAIRSRGKTLGVNSDYRTIAQQLILYNGYRSKRCPSITSAAPPGSSNHQSGLALDVSDHNGWRPHLEKFGWKWFGDRDDVHFDYPGRSLKHLSILAFQRLWNRKNPKDKIDEDGQYGTQTEVRLNNSPVSGFRDSNFSDIIQLSETYKKWLSGY